MEQSQEVAVCFLQFELWAYRDEAPNTSEHIKEWNWYQFLGNGCPLMNGEIVFLQEQRIGLIEVVDII